MTLPMTECPQCGHTLVGMTAVDSKTRVDDLAAGAQLAEVQSVKDEVRRLDDLIRHLNQDRSNLLRRINDIQAATSPLPPEVLSTVFQFACPPIDFSTHTIPVGLPHDPDLRRETFHFNLAAVSCKWREVVWSTPQLWTTIALEAYEPAAENNASILELYFRNAQSIPMTVELDFRAQLSLMNDGADEGACADLLSSLEPIRKTVFIHNAAKIQNLILTGLPVEWLPSLGKNLSQCKSIILYPSLHTRDWDKGRGQVNLTELPYLQCIRLGELNTLPNLSWSKITALHLQNMSIKMCVELLIKCPNLITFESTAPYHDPDSSPSLSKPIVLEHLESLIWYTIRDEWDIAFCRYVRFVKLRTLHWAASYEGHPSQQDFFSSLPTTLISLTFSDLLSAEDFAMMHLLSSIPHIPELHFIRCSPDIVDRVITVIGHPITALREYSWGRRRLGTNSTGPKVLPCLRLLALINRDVGGPGRPEKIVGMLEIIRAAGTHQQCFHLVVDRWEDFCNLETLPRIQALVSSGFDIKLTTGSYSSDLSTLFELIPEPGVPLARSKLWHTPDLLVLLPGSSHKVSRQHMLSLVSTLRRR